MKTKLIIIGVAGIIGSMTMLAGTVLGGVLNPTVSVNGTVQSQCGSGVNGVLDISIDPSVVGPQAITITTNATVKCTNLRAVTVSAASAGSGASDATGSLSGTMKDGTATYSINYTLVYNNNITGLGFGAGKDVPILVSGSVAQADAENAVYVDPDTYTDTVTLTVTF